MEKEKLWDADPEWIAKRTRWLQLFDKTIDRTDITVTQMNYDGSTIEIPLDHELYSRYHRYINWQQLTSDSKKLLENIVIVANGFGLCSKCDKPSKLHQSNITGVELSYCWAHQLDTIIEEHLRWDTYTFTEEDSIYFPGAGEVDAFSLSRELKQYLFVPAGIIAPKHQEQREICRVCSNVLLEDNEMPEDYYSDYHSVIATSTWGREIKEFSIHASCGVNCTYTACDYYTMRGYNMPQLDNQFVCATHFDVLTDGIDVHECEYCNHAYTDDNDLHYSDARGASLCGDCYEGEWECGNCGSSRYGEEDHWCDDDECSNDSEYISSYSYKPRPVFFGNDHVFLGIELEVEDRNERTFQSREDMAAKVMGINKDRYYLKEDGSLNYGFEIVTHPHSLDQYQNHIDWSFLDKLKRSGFVSWNSSSCGLHVHIGLSAFVNQAHEARFTKFIYDNQRQVSRIAGRESNYASFSDKGKAVKKIKMKETVNWDRYQAVNNLNRNTLEVRVFKGSLRKERVLSAIEFVHAVCEYTRSLKASTKGAPFSWGKFVGYVAANADTYPNFFIILNESFDRKEVDNNQEEMENA